MTKNKVKASVSRKSADPRGKKFRTPDKAREKRFYQDKGPRHERAKLVCRECQAVYDGNSWMPFKKLNLRNVDKMQMGLCPSCHEKNDHVSDGVLHLSGTGLATHHEEIKNLIVNMGKTAEEKDILDRVERIDDVAEDEMDVYTNKNQLAVKIGKHINDAYKGGTLEIQWSKDDKPVEIHWHFDLKEKK